MNDFFDVIDDLLIKFFFKIFYYLHVAEFLLIQSF
jgi:hypothetical protein